MVTDRALMLRKLADLERHREELREYEELSTAEYRRDWKVQRIVERTLQIMVEICSDVASHIVAEERLRPGRSTADTFRSLGEAGIVPADLELRLVQMAGFRNVVVHGYDDVDAEVVMGILRRHLDDFLDFTSAIRAFLGE